MIASIEAIETIETIEAIEAIEAIAHPPQKNKSDAQKCVALSIFHSPQIEAKPIINNQGSGKHPFLQQTSGEHQSYPVELDGGSIAS